MKEYTIVRMSGEGRRYALLNPSGVPIAWNMSWRAARSIAGALNWERELRGVTR